MKQYVPRQQMEAFASMLEAAKRRQALPAAEFDGLHAQFRAEDAAGVVWTVGIHTRKWHRREQSGWIEAAPPEGVFLDDAVIAAIARLAPRQPGPVQQPAAPVPPAAVSACARCGATISQGNRFCPGCGAPVAAAPSPAQAAMRRCRTCGSMAAPHKKFCPVCGAAMA